MKELLCTIASVLVTCGWYNVYLSGGVNASSLIVHMTVWGTIFLAVFVIAAIIRDLGKLGW
jgi:hypothetical protein